MPVAVKMVVIGGGGEGGDDDGGLSMSSGSLLSMASTVRLSVCCMLP